MASPTPKKAFSLFGETLIYQPIPQVKLIYSQARHTLWKFERIYRELLLNSLNQVAHVHQEDIAKKCNVSLGLVNKTIKKLTEAKAVEATRQGVRVLSPARLLNLWAAERNLNKDIWQAFRLDPITETERNLPKDTLLTAFSAWYKTTDRKPAEYDRTYFYVTNKENFNNWLNYRKQKTRKANPNTFALFVNDSHLTQTSKKGIVCIPQIYVDIYSINGPEASPYLRDITTVHPSLSPW